MVVQDVKETAVINENRPIDYQQPGHSATVINQILHVAVV